MVSLAVIVPATDAPSTLPLCLEAITSADDLPEELVVVEEPAKCGPAAARNAGVSRTGADVLVFVDADVLVHRDAFTRIRSAFEADPTLGALFGSYDDRPEAPGIVSRFRNLLHYHVHQEAAGPATTFWAGLGAVRRSIFLDVGGFDAERFPRPSIEDIDLGTRLVADGRRILLDPALQGTHLKRWTLRDMLRTDLMRRGVPWVALILRRRTATTALNLGWRHRLSAAASLALLTSLLWRRPWAAAGALLGLGALNRRFYALLVRRLGLFGTAAGVTLHVVHHLTGLLALPGGVALRILERLRERRET